MKKIPKKILENMLEIYKPSCRYLIGAESEYPSARGLFKIPKSFYTKSQSGHFNAVEMVLCYNQLAYTFFADSIEKGLIGGIEKINSEEFKEKYQLNNSLILKMDEVKFKKEINPKEFIGEIKINRIIPLKKIIYIKTSYNFKKGEAIGNIDLGFRRK